MSDQVLRVQSCDGSGQSFIEVALKGAVECVDVKSPSFNQLPEYIQNLVSSDMKDDVTRLIELTAHYVYAGCMSSGIRDILSSRGYLLEERSCAIYDLCFRNLFIERQNTISKSILEMWISENIWRLANGEGFLFKDFEGKDLVKALRAFVRQRFRGYTHIPHPTKATVDHCVASIKKAGLSRQIANVMKARLPDGRKRLSKGYISEYLLTRYMAEINSARAYAYFEIDCEIIYPIIRQGLLTSGDKNIVRVATGSDALIDYICQNMTDEIMTGMMGARILFSAHIDPDRCFFNMTQVFIEEELERIKTGDAIIPVMDTAFLWWPQDRIRANASRDIHLRPAAYSMLWAVYAMRYTVPAGLINTTDPFERLRLCDDFIGQLVDDIERKRDGEYLRITEMERVYYFLEAEKFCQKSLRRNFVRKVFQDPTIGLTFSTLFDMANVSTDMAVNMRSIDLIRDRMMGGIYMDFIARKMNGTEIVKTYMNSLLKGFSDAMKQERYRYSPNFEYNDIKSDVRPDPARFMRAPEWADNEYRQQSLQDVLGNNSMELSYTDYERSRYSLGVRFNPPTGAWTEEVIATFPKDLKAIWYKMDRQRTNWVRAHPEQKRDEYHDLMDMQKRLIALAPYARGASLVEPILDKIRHSFIFKGRLVDAFGMSNPLIFESAILSRKKHNACAAYPFVDMVIRLLRLGLFYHWNVRYSSQIHYKRKNDIWWKIEPAYEFVYPSWDGEPGFFVMKRGPMESIAPDCREERVSPTTYLVPVVSGERKGLIPLDLSQG